MGNCIRTYASINLTLCNLIHIRKVKNGINIFHRVTYPSIRALYEVDPSSAGFAVSLLDRTHLKEIMFHANPGTSLPHPCTKSHSVPREGYESKDKAIGHNKATKPSSSPIASSCFTADLTLNHCFQYVSEILSIERGNCRSRYICQWPLFAT